VAKDYADLEQIQRRVLWLATRMIDYANNERPNVDGIKVGGHQASSASLVTVMTALWFKYLKAEDQVSVKPHASPILHAINYLLGNLDKDYLTKLRSFGGLQSYPSRTKDPDRIDFSTGSVGLGAAAPLFSGVTRRYVDSHFGARPKSKFIALIGDAELDEGNIWEAVADPATTNLENVLWIVDFNRQSLDRVIPGVRIHQWRQQFEAAGWHVAEVKYGQKLKSAFAQPNSAPFQEWLDQIPNEQYQSIFGLEPAAARARFLDGASESVAEFFVGKSDEEVIGIVTDLGGHDFAALLEELNNCEKVTDRPSVIFAYTVKGWGLPLAGNPRNHSAALNSTQIAEFRNELALDLETEWNRFESNSELGKICEIRQNELRISSQAAAITCNIPKTSELQFKASNSTQEAFGRILTTLSRDRELAKYIVTTAPDVATSTNLGGFINRVGVYSPSEKRAWNVDPVLKWAEGPTGQHIELGISEMNLFMLLGALGLSDVHSGQKLIPIGTVYDPFVLRGLDSLIHGVYSDSRFIVAGTPSGVTLSPEGGAHQSSITASVGIELPGMVLIEPSYATALDWLLCNAISNVAAANSMNKKELVYYFRLSTRAVVQEPFEKARVRIGDENLRNQVLNGAYQLIDGKVALQELGIESEFAPEINLVSTGVVIPEVLLAAQQLASRGIIANVIDVVSPSRVFQNWQESAKSAIQNINHLQGTNFIETLISNKNPIVSIHDASSHAMSWIGSALGVYQIALGVDAFGQSGTIPDLYRINNLDTESIVKAATFAITKKKFSKNWSHND